MENRIKKRIVNIDEAKTTKFWQNRSIRGMGLKTVLLNEELPDEILEKRNLKEFEIVKKILPREATVLDIGCGIGRWADNLKNIVKSYTGIDYTERFIETARSKFPHNDKIKFFKMSVTDIDKQKLSGKYDVAIATGILMYINEQKLPDLMAFINNCVSDTVYIQESVCVKKERLTLDNIWSGSLGDNYSAIYRTPEEYEKLFSAMLKDFKINQSGMLLDEEMTVHSETSAKYFILKRIR